MAGVPRDTCKCLRGAGFTQVGIISITKKVAGKNSSRNVRGHDDNQRRRVVMPLFHKFSLHIKVMAAGFHVEIVLDFDPAKLLHLLMYKTNS